MDEICNTNFSEKLKKIEDMLNLWSLRNLTLVGKVRVINTLIVPQLLYLGNVIHMPKKYIKQYQKLVQKFIWNSKPPKVKYRTMINTTENGGMNLQDITCKMASLKLK
jgi:hypothetical protein